MLFGFAVLIVGTVGPLFTHDVAPFVVFRILQGAGFSAVTTASRPPQPMRFLRRAWGKESATTGLARRFPCRLDRPRSRPRIDDPPENLFVGVTAIAVVGFR